MKVEGSTANNEEHHSVGRVPWCREKRGDRRRAGNQFCRLGNLEEWGEHP